MDRCEQVIDLIPGDSQGQFETGGGESESQRCWGWSGESASQVSSMYVMWYYACAEQEVIAQQVEMYVRQEAVLTGRTINEALVGERHGAFCGFRG